MNSLWMEYFLAPVYFMINPSRKDLFLIYSYKENANYRFYSQSVMPNTVNNGSLSQHSLILFHRQVTGNFSGFTHKAVVNFLQYCN